MGDNGQVQIFILIKPNPCKIVVILNSKTWHCRRYSSLMQNLIYIWNLFNVLNKKLSRDIYPETMTIASRSSEAITDYRVISTKNLRHLS